jgi:methionyl-tRNA synthetase
MGEKKFYITTAIDYVNGPPHIGHALEKVQADVLARFHRLKGQSVFFLTGTDEHGAKNARTAKSKGVPVEKLTKEMSDAFESLKNTLNLSWDYFIRTSNREIHWPGVVLMWRKLMEAGDIYKKSYKGLYCVGHEAFITQKDLVGGKCRDHLTEPEIVEEENYFFRLSKYSNEIGKRIESGKLQIFPEGRQNEILSLIENRGLEDVSFSRPSKDLSWGIPVPGDETQTIYVWCDALTNYLSAIGYGRNDDYEKWWPADVQIVGKDILRFHAAIWPGMLLSAGLPLPKKLLVHGHITVDGQKISKTIGNVVDPVVLSEKYGSDALRYYLLREIPTTEDGDYSEAKFKERYNADLANGLGNFAARVLTLAEAEKEFAGDLKPEKDIVKHIDSVKNAVYAKTEEFKFHEALRAIWGLIGFGDVYVNKTAPWDIEYEEKKLQTIFNLVVILDNVAALLKPFLPDASQKITNCIEWDGKLKVKKCGVLFPRLT